MVVWFMTDDKDIVIYYEVPFIRVLTAKGNPKQSEK